MIEFCKLLNRLLILILILPGLKSGFFHFTISQAFSWSLFSWTGIFLNNRNSELLFFFIDNIRWGIRWQLSAWLGLALSEECNQVKIILKKKGVSRMIRNFFWINTYFAVRLQNNWSKLKHYQTFGTPYLIIFPF